MGQSPPQPETQACSGRHSRITAANSLLPHSSGNGWVPSQSISNRFQHRGSPIRQPRARAADRDCERQGWVAV